MIEDESQAIDLYLKMAQQSSYKDIGWFNRPVIEELRGKFQDDEIIEMLLACPASSAVHHDYGHIRYLREDMIALFGKALIPFLELRLSKPIGWASGSDDRAQDHQRVQRFCRETLELMK